MSSGSASNPDDVRGRSRGLMLVVSGPSGVGKTSIVREVRKRHDAQFSVSATTRPAAEGEVDGRDYFFLTRDRFIEMRDNGELLEFAQVYGDNWYGTPRAPVERTLAEGHLLILDIDVQGALQVRETMPEALMIFILPPSDEELLRRLRSRAREGEDVIQRRFAEAKREIEIAHESGVYDHMIVNDDLPRAIEGVSSIITDHAPAATGGVGRAES